VHQPSREDVAPHLPPASIRQDSIPTRPVALRVARNDSIKD
jgi:hypothetical protein